MKMIIIWPVAAITSFLPTEEGGSMERFPYNISRSTAEHFTTDTAEVMEKIVL
jgi:hypothetical protein